MFLGENRWHLSESFHCVLWVHSFVRMISCCVSILHFLYVTITAPRLVSALAARNSVSAHTTHSKRISFLLVIYPDVGQLFHLVDLLGLGKTLALNYIISLVFLCVKLSTPQWKALHLISRQPHSNSSPHTHTPRGADQKKPGGREILRSAGSHCPLGWVASP